MCRERAGASGCEGWGIRKLSPHSVCLAPRPPSALVIPLIRTNQWKRPAGEASPDPVGGDRVEGQAIREIIEGEWASGTQVSGLAIIPSLMLEQRENPHVQSPHPFMLFLILYLFILITRNGGEPRCPGC